LIDNPSGEILIVQKILPESLDRRDAYFLKRRPYLGEIHKAPTNASLAFRN